MYMYSVYCIPTCSAAAAIIFLFEYIINGHGFTVVFNKCSDWIASDFMTTNAIDVPRNIPGKVDVTKQLRVSLKPVKNL